MGFRLAFGRKGNSLRMNTEKLLAIHQEPHGGAV